MSEHTFQSFNMEVHENFFVDRIDRISLLIEMIICFQICCKISSFCWSLEKLKLQQKNFLIDFHGKTLKYIF